jgi:hypothetical protein
VALPEGWEAGMNKRDIAPGLIVAHADGAQIG